MYFGENIKLLRKRAKKSQETVAASLELSRSALVSYEINGVEPDFDTLIRFSEYFKVSLDKLLKTDLSKLSESVLSDIEKGYDIDISGARMRILATTVNQDNEENIELVPLKAQAGYTTGYADPDFIKVLQTFNLPFLDKNRKYRSFPITGDSMPPVIDGSWVTGEYVQNWNQVKSGYPYIVVTRNDGIVFKVVYNQIEQSKTLRLVSTNPMFLPYEVSITEIIEIWKFVNYISSELPDEKYASRNIVSNAMKNIEKEMNVIKNTFKNQD